MSEEWGPWIEHDGRGCPCLGSYVHAVSAAGTVIFTVAGSHQDFNRFRYPHGSWDWRNAGTCDRVLRYRIRKPRGLTILESLIADLPAPVGPKVDA